jgi:hypothetical protein
MTIAALPPMTAMPSRTPEAMEGPGPDHDGDSDDKSVGAAVGTGVAPSAPKGMGTVVDTRA